MRTTTPRVKREETKTYQHRADAGVTQAPANELVPLQFNGFGIHELGEKISLTDMWKAAGSPDAQRPADWRDYAGRAFIDAVAMANNAVPDGIFTTTRGRNGQTFGHWQAALGYAQYLSPEFHMWCNTVVRRHMEGRLVPTVRADLDADTRKVIGGIVKGVIHKEVTDALAEARSEMLEELQDMMDRANRRIGSLEYIPVLDVLKEHDIPAKGRRGLSQRCSALLRRYSLLHKFPMRESGETGRWLYHVEAIKGWVQDQGIDIFRRHKAKLAGDGELFRVVDGGKAAS